jgi:hypothetical protein
MAFICLLVLVASLYLVTLLQIRAQGGAYARQGSVYEHFRSLGKDTVNMVTSAEVL